MAGLDGISYLVAVTQMKANNANDQALHGAEDQRKLVKQQELLRNAQQQFEALVHDKDFTEGDEAKTRAIYGALNDPEHGIGANTVTFGNRDSVGDGKMSDLDNNDHKTNNTTVEGIRSELDKAMKSLEAKDRMGNFEIQRLMSAFNQAETLSSNVQKKMDDTISGQQQKIG
jgi:hypothetical protein